MRRTLSDYREIAGDEVISAIDKKAKRLLGKRLLHINSTYQGGGVAEKLASLIPLLNDVGLGTSWAILHGTPDFFTVTKKIHNALQGDAESLTKTEKDLYLGTNEDFSVYTHIDQDCVVIHDPQPLPIIKYSQKRQPWIWRCHIDLSNPNEDVWEFLKKFIVRYDVVVVSSEKYKRKDLPVDQAVIAPCIDPLAPKNREMTPGEIAKYIKEFDVPLDKPLITQVSRFDKWKDPAGVIEVFKLVKKEFDCRLVLCGSMASDDPEGLEIYEEIERQTKHLRDIGDVILINSGSNLFVNALQRISAIILQKSLKEGFGLTVAEALWKEKPVVASKVGGIALQITNGKNGFLAKPRDIDDFAEKTLRLLNNIELREEMGRKGKELVKKKFLTTRILSDYLDLLNQIIE